MRKFTSLLLLCFALGSFAQTPGGVSGSELWFKTAPLNSDLQGYYRWQDFSGDSIRLMLLDSRGVKSELTLPNSSVHFFNFNPSLWLSDGFRSLSASLKHGDLSQATVIGVFSPELATIGKDMVVYALDGRKGDGAILSKDKAVRGRGVEPLDYGSASGEDLLYQSSDSLSENGFKESALRVVSYFKVSNPSTALWGDNSNTTLFIGTPSTSGSFGTDFPTSLFGNASIRGYAPELVVFSRMLTPDERRKVESYLAVKYGITLKGSYLDSDGNLTWDMAENQAYHHRVTAVGSDTAGSLSQPLSATSYEESPVYAALKENGTYHDANPYNPSSASRLLVMGRENGNPMPDRGFTFWGDDDVALATYTSPTDSLWHVMKRTWMVKTNVPSKPDSTVARWTAQGLEVSRNGFTDNIIQEKAASGAYATTQPLLEVAVLLSSPVRQVTRLLTLASEASVAAHASMDSGSPMLELFIRSSTERSQIHTSPRMLTERTFPSARKAKTSICVLTEQEVRQEPYPFRMQLTQTQMWVLSERKEQSPP